jgi:hypothetical protein
LSKCPTRDAELLDTLNEKGFITYTPSRFVEGELIYPYDDPFILKIANEFDAVIVSNDLYRDLTTKNGDFKALVDKK